MWWFILPIFNFSFISSKIPASLACGIYILQLIRYSKAYAQYSDFLDRYKSYSPKATLLLGWSNCCKSSTVVITNCWPLKNFQFSNGNGSFLFYVDFFFSLPPAILLLDLTKWVDECLMRNINCSSFTSSWIHFPIVLVGSMLLIYLVVCAMFFVLFVFVLCFVPNLYISLDFLFLLTLRFSILIDPSVFYNVYSEIQQNNSLITVSLCQPFR